MQYPKNEIHKKVFSLMLEVDRICFEHNIKYSMGFGSVLGAVRHKGFIPWDTDIDIIIPLPELERFREACRSSLPKEMTIFEWDKEKNYHPCFDRIAYRTEQHYTFHVDVFPLCGVPKKNSNQILFTHICCFVYHVLSCKNKNIAFSKKNKKIFILLIKIFLFFIPDFLIKRIYNLLQTKYSYSDSDEVYTISTKYKMNAIFSKNEIMETIRVDFEGKKLPIPKNYEKYLTKLYGDYMTPVKY